MLHASGRVISGSVTVAFGSLSIAYDIYRLSKEVQAIATKRSGDDVWEIASQLETVLNSFLLRSDTLSIVEEHSNLALEVIEESLSTFESEDSTP